MSSVEENPFGNLCFDKHTLATATERSVVALEAALLVYGYAPSSPVVKTVRKLKKALAKDSRYSFNIVPVESTFSSTPVSAEALSYDQELLDIVSTLVGTSLGSKFKRKALPSGHVILVCAVTGDIDDLRVHPGPSATMTETLFNTKLVSLAYKELPKLSSIVVRASTFSVDEEKSSYMAVIELTYAVAS